MAATDRLWPQPHSHYLRGLTSATTGVEQPMKNRGAQRIMEMVMMVAATRGMVCREKTKRFMRIPPNSIPKAAAGRFTAPTDGEKLVWVHRPHSVCGPHTELDHREGGMAS